ncbi:MAG: hypothetical protein ABSG68_19240 [Thermoguttaceae bacterium]
MSESLIPARVLYRFSLPCFYHHPLWTADGAGLDERYRLASLAGLEAEPTQRSPSAALDVRVAWSEGGLALVVRVEGKRQPPWCRGTRPEDSDGLQVWIDTRDIHNVHRAGRFCHRFIFLPTGSGRRLGEPTAACLPIHRAREFSRPPAEGQLKVRSQKRVHGYVLEAAIAAEALTGFDPREHPRLGFAYALEDRELGVQTLGVGSPMPYQEDPSLWATLELVK